MEQAKIRNIDCDKLPSLKRVLEKWISLNREMANAKAFKDHNRVPWWFNERAAVSVLAGAVCKCGNGHYAFEEFIDKKHRTHKPSSKYKGRVDLHINLRGEEFIAEAKFSRTKAETGDSDMIETSLEKAVHDVKECDTDGQKRLAIVFAAPSVSIANHNEIDAIIQQWAERVSAVGHVRAWTFPRSVRLTQGTRHFHPGIAIFIKQV